MLHQFNRPKSSNTYEVPVHPDYNEASARPENGEASARPDSCESTEVEPENDQSQQKLKLYNEWIGRTQSYYKLLLENDDFDEEYCFMMNYAYEIVKKKITERMLLKVISSKPKSILRESFNAFELQLESMDGIDAATTEAFFEVSAEYK